MGKKDKGKKKGKVKPVYEYWESSNGSWYWHKKGAEFTVAGPTSYTRRDSAIRAIHRDIVEDSGISIEGTVDQGIYEEDDE